MFAQDTKNNAAYMIKGLDDFSPVAWFWHDMIREDIILSMKYVLAPMH